MQKFWTKILFGALGTPGVYCSLSGWVLKPWRLSWHLPFTLYSTSLIHQIHKQWLTSGLKKYDIEMRSAPLVGIWKILIKTSNLNGSTTHTVSKWKPETACMFLCVHKCLTEVFSSLSEHMMKAFSSKTSVCISSSDSLFLLTSVNNSKNWN